MIMNSPTHCMQSQILLGHTFATAQPTVRLLPFAGVTQIVTPNKALFSISIEPDRWPEWIAEPAGLSNSSYNNVNSYTNNLLKNIKSLTGVPPSIRIGGDSADSATYNALYPVNAFFNSSKIVNALHGSNHVYPEADYMTMGDKFYDIISKLPSGTNVTLGINLRRAFVDQKGKSSIDLTYARANATALTRSIFRAIPAIRAAEVSVDYIEVGNEPDLYKDYRLDASGGTPTDVQNYAKIWTPVANAVQGLSQPSGARVRFWAASVTGNGQHQNNNEPVTLYFNPSGLFNAGAGGLNLSSGPGTWIKRYSQHNYKSSLNSNGKYVPLFCSPTSTSDDEVRSNVANEFPLLLNKAGTRSLIAKFRYDISNATARKLPFILGETNSYACHGAPGLSNSAAAALWMLDYVLQAAVKGIEKVYIHNGVGYRYNLFQPVTLTRSIMNGAEGHYPAQIHPSYYAAIITGEALGSSPSTQAYEITQASPQTGAFTNISAYAFLESDVLRRIVVINNDLYMSGDTSPRRSTGMSVDISTGGRSYKSMTIKRLSIDHSNDLSGLRWGNRTYETSSGLPAGTTFLETINITGKSVTPEFTLVASEAVLLSFIS